MLKRVERSAEAGLCTVWYSCMTAPQAALDYSDTLHPDTTNRLVEEIIPVTIPDNVLSAALNIHNSQFPSQIYIQKTTLHT